MKKLIYILGLFLVALGISSCNKTEVSYIDGQTPNQRVQEYMDDARAKLKEAPHGWMAYLYNNLDEGYTFHMKFVGSDEVEMYSDFDNTTRSTAGTSIYSMRNIAGPGMVFDTYNYIHILADPNSSISGGVRGEGNYTDFEFVFQQVSADTVLLKGNFRGNKMLLVRATEAEYQAFENNHYNAFRETLQDFVDEYPFLYLSAEGASVPIALTLSLLDRSAQFSYKNTPNTPAEYQTIGMAVGINKVVLRNAFQLGEFSIIEILFRDDKVYGIDIQGNEFLLRPDNEPIEIPEISTVYGPGKTVNACNVLDASKSEGFQSMWNAIAAEFQAAGVSNVLVNLRFLWTVDGQMEVRFERSREVSSFVRMNFTVSTDAQGITTFTYFSSSSSGAARVYMTNLENFMTQNKFVWGWEKFGQMLGGLYMVDDNGNRTGISVIGRLEPYSTDVKNW